MVKATPTAQAVGSLLFATLASIFFMPMATPELQRAYQREWIARRRREWLEENGPCVRCGSWEKLELDHKNRLSKVNHKVWSWRESRRNEELSKCQALCEKCHQLKTTSELSLPIPHGTMVGYKSYRCRCDECREANTKYSRAWRHGDTGAIERLKQELRAVRMSL